MEVLLGLLVCGVIGWAMGKFLTKGFLLVLTVFALFAFLSLAVEIHETLAIVIVWLYGTAGVVMFGVAWMVQLQDVEGSDEVVDKIVGMFIKQK